MDGGRVYEPPSQALDVREKRREEEENVVNNGNGNRNGETQMRKKIIQSVFEKEAKPVTSTSFVCRQH